MWIIPHLRNVPPASLGSSRFILHTINLLFCWTKPCETYYHVYFVYFCLSGPQSWALALFDSLTRVILLQRFWVLWTLDVQEIHMKLSAPKVKNTLQVMRRRRRDIMQGGGHLVQLWWVCSHRRLRSTDADTKLQRGSLSATVHTPACTKAHTHTHLMDQKLIFSISTDPKKFFLGESEAAVLPPSSRHTPGSYEGSRYQSHKEQNGKQTWSSDGISWIESERYIHGEREAHSRNPSGMLQSASNTERIGTPASTTESTAQHGCFDRLHLQSSSKSAGRCILSRRESKKICSHDSQTWKS